MARAYSLYPAHIHAWPSLLADQETCLPSLLPPELLFVGAEFHINFYAFSV